MFDLNTDDSLTHDMPPVPYQQPVHPHPNDAAAHTIEAGSFNAVQVSDVPRVSAYERGRTRRKKELAKCQYSDCQNFAGGNSRKSLCYYKFTATLLVLYYKTLATCQCSHCQNVAGGNSRKSAFPKKRQKGNA